MPYYSKFNQDRYHISRVLKRPKPTVLGVPGFVSYPSYSRQGRGLFCRPQTTVLYQTQPWLASKPRLGWVYREVIPCSSGRPPQRTFDLMIHVYALVDIGMPFQHFEPTLVAPSEPGPTATLLHIEGSTTAFGETLSGSTLHTAARPRPISNFVSYLTRHVLVSTLCIWKYLR